MTDVDDRPDHEPLGPDEPRSIEVVKDRGITIVYGDGYLAEIDLMSLRLACPCAGCRSLREQGQESWPRPSSPLPLRIEGAELHGGWGLTIAWNDGHGTGIYPFDSLRRFHEDGEPFARDSGLGA